jgi:hypothetical protein
MKLAITIRQTDAGWEIDAAIPGLPVVTRAIPAGEQGFPLPPAAEAQAWAASAARDLATDSAPVKVLRQKILTGDTSNDAVPILGGYLRGILLGPVWDQVEAATAPAEAVEIEIDCDPTDTLMSRLPWEMMISGTQPLGAQKGRVVAVTRLVQGADPDPAAVEIPLRVLFVIGRQLDASLRPGAEYLGILRQVNATLQNGALGARSVDINLQLLPIATKKELETAIESFQPAVVHFIAHGRMEGQESVIILSKQSGVIWEEDPCTAANLVELLRRQDGLLPPIVVLNACHTGEAAGANDAYIPFAASLVRGGVAVALGMAGEVADAACRIFTRAFYQALVDGKPIALAAAFARRAVMLHDADLLSNAEWTRPTLFRNAKALPTIQVNKVQRAVAQAAFRFRSVREPQIFCDRIDAIHAYQNFRDQVFKGDVRTPLVLEVSDDDSTVSAGAGTGRRVQIGKSRAVSEIASNAVLQGLAPCVLTSAAAFEPPPTLLLLAIRIAEAMDDSREFLGLERRVTSSALRIAFKVAGHPYVFDPAQMTDFKLERDTVKAMVAKPDARALEAGIVRDIVKEDVSYLLDELKVHFPAGQGQPHFKAVLVLIDDLHKYDGIAVALLELVRDFGMAPGAALAFTYSTRLNVGPDIAEFIKGNLRGFVYEPLRPFRNPEESRMAYTQMLLARKVPLAPSWKKKDLVPAFFDYCHKMVLGVPSLFALSEQTIDYSKNLGVLIDADDERILAERATADAQL